MLKGFGKWAHLYKVHPHFDNYPQYLKDALITNERLQGRAPDKTTI